MQDVGARSSPANSLDQLRDSQVLSAAGSRAEKTQVLIALGLWRSVDGPGVLGVHDEDSVVGR